MATTFCLQHEPRPSDFSARIKRSRQRTIASRRSRKTHGRSALAVLGAIALPAFAQPGSWDRFQIGDAETSEAAVEPMPFEQAGSSFPGSAFYYLDTDEQTPGSDEGIHSDADADPVTRDPDPDAVARPLRVDNSGVDRTRAEQCLTAAIFYEAASESQAGQRAVAQVVLNRVAHPAYPNSVCGVVYQGSERGSGCQFSFACDGSLARKPRARSWQRAQRIARDALSGYVYTPVGLATHYHTVRVHPYWASSLSYIGTIGAHRFYSFKGAAGRQATYRFAYAGAEPLPVRHNSTAAAASADDTDPLAIQRNFEEQPDKAGASLTPVSAGPEHDPAPAYSQELRERGGDAVFRAGKLPEAAGVKPEYRNSGQWIAQPTS